MVRTASRFNILFVRKFESRTAEIPLIVAIDTRLNRENQRVRLNAFGGESAGFESRRAATGDPPCERAACPDSLSEEDAFIRSTLPVFGTTAGSTNRWHA
jgi:hypothetical protein